MVTVGPIPREDDGVRIPRLEIVDIHDPPVCSITPAIREGIDDYRYLRTLKQFATAATTADEETLRNAGRAGLQLLDKICDAAPAVVSEAKVAEQDKPSLAIIGAERRRVAAAIVRIQKAASLVADAFDVSDR